ncbi:oxaloacetate tautomerase FAHD1, mitochondrial-like [Glandiceps talaboti]
MASRLVNFVEKGRKILGVALNYSDFAAAVGATPPPKPWVFLKPLTSYIQEGTPIKTPPGCKEVFHEVELGIIIGKTGSKIPKSSAMDYIGGYTLSLDLTAMDWIREARKNGSPWELSKGFDTACPVGDFIPKEKIPNPHNLGLWCKVNDELRQNGNTKNLIFDIPTLISYISESMTIEEGDLILTGSPAGVGPIYPGDTIICGLENITEMTFHVSD